jgi:DNA invertase Pin-like site-specific DNA recombinase
MREKVYPVSLSRKDRDSTAFLYERLSRDDNMDGESYSIGNQKKLLAKVAKEKGFTNLIHFSDDGISGVSMDRPGYKAMIAELMKGHAAAVFVKDMSRLGRNYIEVGKLTEEFFPENDIRLIAVSDNVDTAEGENEMTPIRNLFNEWYARDISKKRRISNKIKGNAGEPMGQPPYGYIKDPDDPKRWIIEQEAASVVQRIFRLTLEGLGTDQIASALFDSKIITPTFYWHERGIKRAGKLPERDPCGWRSSTVIKILSTQEYCGDVINFKTYSKSYKNKKRIPNDKDNWVVFKDVHEAIVDRADWEKVQQRHKRAYRRVQKDGERNMFSGILKCADCGGAMNYHFNQQNHDIEYFNCNNNNRSRKTCDTTHYVRVDFLEQAVLGEIRRLTRFASQHENEFVRVVMGHSQQNANDKRQAKQRELNALISRDKELDSIFERLYEDIYYKGRLSKPSYFNRQADSSVARETAQSKGGR